MILVNMFYLLHPPLEAEKSRLVTADHMVTPPPNIGRSRLPAAVTTNVPKGNQEDVDATTKISRRL